MSQENGSLGPRDGPYGQQGGMPPPGIPPRSGPAGGPQGGPPQGFPPQVPADTGPPPRRTPPLDTGRYWAGAIATVAVAALIGVAGVFVLEDVFGLGVDSPPVAGAGSDATAWAVAGASFALASAVVLHLLAVSTPRPRSFFGWVIGLVTVVLAALPFAGAVDPVPDLLAAMIWIVIGAAVWSLLTATLSYTSDR